LNIWFVVGVSGAGKSHFSEYAAGHLGFFHYEIDQTPHNGITHFGLRTQWDKFLDEFEADGTDEEPEGVVVVVDDQRDLLEVHPRQLITATGTTVIGHRRPVRRSWRGTR